MGLPCPINGGWTGYGVFGGCTKTCGGGQQVALRYCNNPAPMYNGNTCSGSDKKVQSCNTQNCPIDGKYSPWKPWGQCSHSCGGGTQTRSRTCTPPKCEGKQECSMQATDQVFGSDPCKMTFKYMEIMYQCYGGRYPDLADEEQPEIPLLE